MRDNVWLCYLGQIFLPESRKSISCHPTLAQLPWRWRDKHFQELSHAIHNVQSGTPHQLSQGDSCGKTQTVSSLVISCHHLLSGFLALQTPTCFTSHTSTRLKSYVHSYVILLPLLPFLRAVLQQFWSLPMCILSLETLALW